MIWRSVVLVVALAVGVTSACSEDCDEGEQGEIDCSEWS